MKLFRRLTFLLALVGVLGTGAHAISADPSDCFTLSNPYTCVAHYCCPNGSGGFTCTPAPPPIICY